jgi:hypothetical protein
MLRQNRDQRLKRLVAPDCGLRRHDALRVWLREAAQGGRRFTKHQPGGKRGSRRLCGIALFGSAVGPICAYLNMIHSRRDSRARTCLAIALQLV